MRGPPVGGACCPVFLRPRRPAAPPRATRTTPPAPERATTERKRRWQRLPLPTPLSLERPTQSRRRANAASHCVAVAVSTRSPLAALGPVDGHHGRRCLPSA